MADSPGFFDFENHQLWRQLVDTLIAVIEPAILCMFSRWRLSVVARGYLFFQPVEGDIPTYPNTSQQLTVSQHVGRCWERWKVGWPKWLWNHLDRFLEMAACEIQKMWHVWYVWLYDTVCVYLCACVFMRVWIYQRMGSVKEGIWRHPWLFQCRRKPMISPWCWMFGGQIMDATSYHQLNLPEIFDAIFVRKKPGMRD